MDSLISETQTESASSGRKEVKRWYDISFTSNLCRALDPFSQDQKTKFASFK